MYSEDVVWAKLRDGSHMEYRQGILTKCWQNHKKFNRAFAIWVGIAIAEFSLIVYLLNRALEQKGW